MPRNRQTARKAQNSSDTGFNVEDAKERINELGEQIQSGLSEIGEQASARLRQLNVKQSTIPDAFRRMPKFISPQVHRWLDVAVTGYFGVLGTIFAVRGRVGPAIAAFANAGMVGGVSAFTDYTGNGEKPISFKLHGTLDAMQATTAALGPVLHGFADEPESAFFFAQAANELAVIAGTDWDAGMRGRKKRARKAA
ncbi:MAG TPA: hypothetical protein VFA90_10620 [Terriglobales bacterium]|nr:hypothetical protein [Terriglobales bacterium]